MRGADQGPSLLLSYVPVSEQEKQKEWAGSESPHLCGIRVQCCEQWGPSQPYPWCLGR